MVKINFFYEFFFFFLKLGLMNEGMLIGGQSSPVSPIKIADTPLDSMFFAILFCFGVDMKNLSLSKINMKSISHFIGQTDRLFQVISFKYHH